MPTDAGVNDMLPTYADVESAAQPLGGTEHVLVARRLHRAQYGTYGAIAMRRPGKSSTTR